MADNIDTKPTASGRERVQKRLREKYPEKQFEEDDEIYGQISDDFDKIDEEIGGYRDREQKLSDMFAADPRSAQYLTDMYNGNDPVIGLVRNFGEEIKDILDDPEMQEKIAEANKEYMERVAKSKELDEEYDKNIEETFATMKEYQEANGYSDEDMDKLANFLFSVVRDGVIGKFSKSTLEMGMKALNFENAVAEAAEDGEVAGRNAKITEQLRKREKGDGTMPLGGKNGSAETPAAQKRQSIFDLARS